MNFKSTLFYFLLFVSFSTYSQEITGVWKGHFVQNTFGYYEDRYKFEVQIEQLGNNAINGVTYSYKTTVFYGKASLTGFYTKKTNVVTIAETKLLEVKIDGESQPCIMTCYLEYSKMGNLETLTGTYTSKNLKDKTDCGSGKVYLEKSLASDFYKEDFLVKRENELRKKQEAKPEKKTSPDRPLVQNRAVPKTASPVRPLASNRSPRPSTPARANATPKGVATTKPAVKPGAEENLLNIPERKNVTRPEVVAPQRDETVKVPEVTERPRSKPEVIIRRKNELVKTIYTSAKEVRIDLYDNGEIDGDTISVFHNNALIVSKKGLTHKPISLNIKLNEATPVHEFVLVAENEGSIRPNTSSMIVTAEGNRHEPIIVSTDEKKNATIIIKFKADAPK